ncbi:MAG TPA: hypothetical protein VFO95_03200 [Gemmatimonadales bacterium]|nr:hypothetical protein [Gemmatimonadales bacterium]
MSSTFRTLTCGILALSAAGCSRTIIAGNPPPPQRTVVVEKDSDHRGPLGVPPGHLPPPGQCRLWFPGRPPGHQPKPGSCARNVAEAPAGAWVLYRPARDRKVVHARVIDTRRPGVVVAVRVYDADRGAYLRQEKP